MSLSAKWLSAPKIISTEPTSKGTVHLLDNHLNDMLSAIEVIYMPKPQERKAQQEFTMLF